MTKRATKISISIILAGIFIIAAFIGIAREQLDPIFYIIVFFLIVFVFSFGIAIGQNISTPLQKLVEKATELSKGNLSSRIYLESKDELSELADTLNKIAEELQSSHEQGTNIEKSLGVKVKAKTQELEETINALDQKVKNRTIELERLIKESNQLKEIMKSKEAETEQLKKDFEDLKQKTNK